jgi:hypothetical protein
MIKVSIACFVTRFYSNSRRVGKITMYEGGKGYEQKEIFNGNGRNHFRNFGHC